MEWKLHLKLNCFCMLGCSLTCGLSACACVCVCVCVCPCIYLLADYLLPSWICFIRPSWSLKSWQYVETLKPSFTLCHWKTVIEFSRESHMNPEAIWPDCLELGFLWVTIIAQSILKENQVKVQNIRRFKFFFWKPFFLILYVQGLTCKALWTSSDYIFVLIISENHILQLSPK